MLAEESVRVGRGAQRKSLEGKGSAQGWASNVVELCARPKSPCHTTHPLHTTRAVDACGNECRGRRTMDQSTGGLDGMQAVTRPFAAVCCCALTAPSLDSSLCRSACRGKHLRGSMPKAEAVTCTSLVISFHCNRARSASSTRSAETLNSTMQCFASLSLAAIHATIVYMYCALRTVNSPVHRVVAALSPTAAESWHHRTPAQERRPPSSHSCAHTVQEQDLHT